MGLNYMVGRVQDAVTGRWLSADPYIPDVMAPQSYNRYSYVDNNPVTYIDPTGFDDAPPFPGGGVVVNSTTESNPNAGPGGVSVVGDNFSLPGGTFASIEDLNDAAITSRLQAHADHQAAKGTKGGNPDSGDSQGDQSQQTSPPAQPSPPPATPQQPKSPPSDNQPNPASPPSRPECGCGDAGQKAIDDWDTEETNLQDAAGALARGALAEHDAYLSLAALYDEDYHRDLAKAQGVPNGQ